MSISTLKLCTWSPSASTASQSWGRCKSKTSMWIVFVVSLILLFLRGILILDVNQTDIQSSPSQPNTYKKPFALKQQTVWICLILPSGTVSPNNNRSANHLRPEQDRCVGAYIYTNTRGPDKSNPYWPLTAKMHLNLVHSNLSVSIVNSCHAWVLFSAC